MPAKKESTTQIGFYSIFEEQLSHSNSLYILANKTDWKVIEDAFFWILLKGKTTCKAYSFDGFIIDMKKNIRNISDESVVEQWVENIYYQYSSGEKSYAFGVPWEASELVHFRNHIGVEGIELIFKESICVNGKDGYEDHATTGTTVQKKTLFILQTINWNGRS